MYATTILETSAMKAWERAMYFVANSPLKLKFGGGAEVKHALDSQTSIILDENAVNELINEFGVCESDPMFGWKHTKDNVCCCNDYIYD